MAQTWPVSLQQYIDQAGFKFAFGKTTVKTEMDTGPAKIRNRSTKSIDSMSGKIRIKKSDFSTLETFFKTTLNMGALPFTYNHPITDVATDWVFKEPPSISSVGGEYFDVDMSWETA